MQRIKELFDHYDGQSLNGPYLCFRYSSIPLSLARGGQLVSFSPSNPTTRVRILPKFTVLVYKLFENNGKRGREGPITTFNCYLCIV